MDRAVPTLNVLFKQGQDMLGAKAVALQLPIGAEDNFKGVVDRYHLG